MFAAALALSVLLPAESQALPAALARIVSPQNLEEVGPPPVEVIVEFQAAAIPRTFKAWLNDRNVTGSFQRTPTGMRALLGAADGLRVQSVGGPPLEGTNLLVTRVDGSRNRWDIDAALFFVRAPVVVVPDLVGLPSDAAIALLEQSGLALGIIREEFRASIRTGIVLGQGPLAGTEVAPGTPVDLVRVAEPPPDVTLPDAWAGVWDLEITYRGADGNIDSVLPISDAICPGDPLGIAAVEATGEASPFADLTSCSAIVTDQHIEAFCSGRISNSVCSFDVAASFAMDLAGDTLTGTGQWAFGDICGLPFLSDGQTFELEAHRTSLDSGALCQPPRSSFLQKFMKNNLLIQTGGAL